MKKKVLAICSFNNTAHIFLEVAELYENDWDLHILLLFKDPELESFLDGKSIPYSVEPRKKIKSRPLRLMRDFFHNRSAAKKLCKTLTDRHEVDLIFNFEDDVFGLGKWVNQMLNDRGALSLRYAWAIYTEAAKNTPLSTVTKAYLKFAGFKIKGQFQLQSVTHYTLCKSLEAKKTLTDFGIPEDKIVDVGSHQYDLLDKTRQRKSLENGILIMSQPVDYEIFIPAMKQLVNKLLEYVDRIALKLHPRDDVNQFNWFRDHESVDVLEHSLFKPTRELIHDSSCMIVYSSTTSLEALYLRKNILFYDFDLPIPATRKSYKKVASHLTEYGYPELSQALLEKGIDAVTTTPYELYPEGVESYLGGRNFKKKLDRLIDGKGREA